MRRLLFLSLAFAVVGCAQAARVFFDLPERPPPPPQEDPQEPSLPSSGSRLPPGMMMLQVPVEDTVRPAIESVGDPDSVWALLPKDAAGGVDWSEAQRKLVIKPKKTSENGAGEPLLEGFGFDLRMKGDMEPFDAFFPHSSHTQLLSCRGCHPDLVAYPPEPITMAQINEGEACGACHGPVAFGPETCGRCHPWMGSPGTADSLGYLGMTTLARKSTGESPEGGSAFALAVFPHWAHRIRYTCSVCHPAPFAMEAGTDTLTMADLQEGKSCGQCHDGGVAFGLVSCTRCHVPPVQEDPTSG